jgi:hypothetical protein
MRLIFFKPPHPSKLKSIFEIASGISSSTQMELEYPNLLIHQDQKLIHSLTSHSQERSKQTNRIQRIIKGLLLLGF